VAIYVYEMAESNGVLTQKIKDTNLFFALIIGLCVAVSIVFHLRISVPVLFSVLISVAILVRLSWCVQQDGSAIVVTILSLVYALPFIHIIPYIWFDYSDSPAFFWGLQSNPYMFDKLIIELTALIGAAGLIGIYVGREMYIRKKLLTTTASYEPSSKVKRTLSMGVWLMWMVPSVLLSWATAPRETMFTTVYTGSESVLSSANFSSSWMVSYVLLTFGIVDAHRERSKVLRFQKGIISVGVLLYVVVWLQLFRGDRESLPWVIGLLFYALVVRREHGPKPAGVNIRVILGATIGLAAVGAVAYVVGVVRSLFAGLTVDEAYEVWLALGESDVFRLTNFISGTWSAVLLTPLSVAGDYIREPFTFKYGNDYVNLLFSLPPGFVADWFGYVRPLSGSSGPAFDMRFGIGGTHATVVPFRNFGILGVISVQALWSYLITGTQVRSHGNRSVISATLIISLIMAGPHWLWYGEKSLINVFVIWFISSYLYSFAGRINPTRPRDS